MTVSPLTTQDPLVVARQAATRAARASGVRIEQAHDMRALEELLLVVRKVWQPAPNNPPITMAVLRALAHSGNYCAVARDDSGVLGVCIGFLGTAPHGSLHSHIAGVLPAGSGRHIGFALKLDQRAWALGHGLDTINWTYDPLVRRNGFFNLGKLGALPTEYLVDFYGELNDTINAGQGSDRLVATWRLRSPRAVAACAGMVAAPDLESLLAAGAHIAVDELDGVPVGSRPPAGTTVALVRVPVDIETLRARDPAAGVRWRTVVRDELGGLIQAGWRVTAMSRSGWYVVERNPSEDQLS
jgi:predicted GNAT superfamily acetyltransferase